MDGHSGLGDIKRGPLGSFEQDTLRCEGEAILQSARSNKQDDLEVGVGGLGEGGCLQGQGVCQKSQNGDHGCD